MGDDNAAVVHNWTFAGPVERDYETSRAPVAAITGPTGGGKSTGSARRCLRVATWQHASPRDGVRRARIVCICPTYRRAWDTVMPSYFKVFPKSMGEFRGSRGDPADHVFDIALTMRGELMHCHVEVLFRAISLDQDIEDFFRGLEATAFWLPEADTNNDLGTILSLAGNRAGRYPEPDDRPGGVAGAYKGVFCDANAPVIGTTYHERFYLRRMPDGSRAPDTDRHLIQPSGFSIKAENLDNLRKIDPNFYPNQALQLDAYDVKRLLENKPGFGRSAAAVHPNFDPDTHVSQGEIAVDPYGMVYIAVDQGSNTLFPAAVFMQRSYAGQWRALAEISPAPAQMNINEFCDEIRRMAEGPRFAETIRRQGAVICIDPAASSPNAASERSYTTAQMIQHLTGIEVMLAPTNKPTYRRAALDELFKRNVAAKEPSFIADRVHCPSLIQALTGGFCYPVRGGAVGSSPVKNEFSHVAEACEYGPLTIDGLSARVDGVNRFIRPGGETGESAPMAIYDA